MKTLIALITLLFVVAACSTAPATAPTPVPTSPDAPSSGGTGAVTSTGATKEFNVVASQFAFDPDTITVDKGDTVIIHVTSADVPHGFAIEGYNVNVAFDKGETKTVTFVADKAGTFQFFCSVPCGSGHRSMKGQLVVN